MYLNISECQDPSKLILASSVTQASGNRDSFLLIPNRMSSNTPRCGMSDQFNPNVDNTIEEYPEIKSDVEIGETMIVLPEEEQNKMYVEKSMFYDIIKLFIFVTLFIIGTMYSNAFISFIKSTGQDPLYIVIVLSIIALLVSWAFDVSLM